MILIIMSYVLLLSYLQTFPSPTAYPMVASINVIFESQASLTSPDPSSGGWEN